MLFQTYNPHSLTSIKKKKKKKEKKKELGFLMPSEP